MTLALYRKYRPGRFQDVVGQEHVTGPLIRALENDRVHHAYLFSGPRGCGKTSSARILARSLNCVQGPTAYPCGECQPCRDLAPNGPGSIDVVEIDAATHRSVENARELRENAQFAPVNSRYTVYIIDEAHQLTKDAGNALLKLIEEPPAHLRFVFATTEPEKILGTIRSRTHHYAFRLLPMGVLRNHLAWICEQEEIAADTAALTLVARAAEGSVRDALSLLGQLVASAGPAGITYEDAVQLVGVTDARVLAEVVHGIAEGNPGRLFDVVDRVIEAGHEPRRFATDVLDRLRDILVIQAMPDAAQRGVIDLPEDQLAELAEQAAMLAPAEATRAAELVNDGLASLRGATAPRLTLEILCARLVLPEAGTSELDLLARIDRVERRLGEATALSGVSIAAVPKEHSTGPAVQASATAIHNEATHHVVVPPVHQAPASGGSGRRFTPRNLSELPGGSSAAARAGSAAGAPDSTPPAPPAPSAEQAAQPSAPPVAPVSAPPLTTPPDAQPQRGAGPTLDQVRGLWPAVVENVKSRSRVAWMSIANSAPLSCEDGTVVAAVADAGAVAHFRKTAYPALVGEALLDVLKADLTFELVHDPSKAGVRSAPPPSAASSAGAAPAAEPESAAAPSTADPVEDVPPPAEEDISANPPSASRAHKLADDHLADDLAGSTDADPGLRGVALIEAELGGEKIDEFET